MSLEELELFPSEEAFASETEAAQYLARNFNILKTLLNDTEKHFIGDAGEPNFVNSWVNDAVGVPTFFTKDRHGRVIFQGVISGGTATRIFTLPTEFFPPGRLAMSASAYTGVTFVPVALQVDPLGRVSYHDSLAYSWISLCGSFYYL